jgi:hypothetical protein
MAGNYGKSSFSTISAIELDRNLTEYLSQVSEQKRSYLIREGSRVLAELRPVSARSTLGDFGKLLSSFSKLPVEESRAFEKDIIDIHREASGN